MLNELHYMHAAPNDTPAPAGKMLQRAEMSFEATSKKVRNL